MELLEAAKLAAECQYLPTCEVCRQPITQDPVTAVDGATIHGCCEKGR